MNKKDRIMIIETCAKLENIVNKLSVTDEADYGVAVDEIIHSLNEIRSGLLLNGAVCRRGGLR